MKESRRSGCPEDAGFNLFLKIGDRYTTADFLIIPH